MTVPHSDFSVRAAAVSDAPALSAFAARVFQEAFGANAPPNAMEKYLSESFPEETVRRELSDPATAFLLAETPTGNLAGYLKLFFGDPLPEVRGEKSAKLWRLYTAGEWQGRGIGARLLERGVVLARERGAQTLWLTVNTGNTGAVRFYERHGFTQTGFTTFDLGGARQTDFVMERPV